MKLCKSVVVMSPTLFFYNNPSYYYCIYTNSDRTGTLFSINNTKYCNDVSLCRAVTHRLNRWPPGRIWPAGRLFMAPELLFLHHVFWLGKHMYIGTCLHANDIQIAGSLTAVSAIFNFQFCCLNSSHGDIVPAVGAWIAQKWHVPSSLLKEKWTVKIGNAKKNGLKNVNSFTLQPA